MKYFVIIFVSLSLALPVYAATMVTGSVPKVEPLQPPPIGVAPDYSKNIQATDPTRPASGGDSLNGQKPQDAGHQADQSNKEPASYNPAATGKKSIPWPAAIILLVGGVGALGYFVYGRKSKV